LASDWEKAYKAEKLKDVTDQTFAESIGVERPQLRKYFRGDAVPSVRTVALAKRKYGISVPYADVDTGRLLGSRAKKRTASRPVQLRLPFSLEFADPRDFEVELKSLKPRKYELLVRVKRA
jgi:transcriptional regulator with XRE-family HTH domain